MDARMAANPAGKYADA